MRVPCAFVLDKSAAFVDGALSEAETIVIADHLESCENCAQIYAQMDLLEIRAPTFSVEAEEHIYTPDYWDDMDTHLDQVIEDSIGLSSRTKSGFDRLHFLLIAVAILCVGWGLYQQSRISALSLVVESQEKELKRLHEVYIQTSPEFPNPYINSGRAQQVRYDL